MSTTPTEPPDQPRRVLAVFAHPDDETLSAGGLLALLAQTAQVHLVTSNRGERGEVIPTDIAHLEGRAEELADLRVAELTGATRALGITEQTFFDQLPGHSGPGRYTDSGMRWDGASRVRALPDPDAEPSAFSKADPERAAQVLAAHVRSLRPDLVVTDEPDGGYGHPDHVHASTVTARAVRLAADPQAAVDGEAWSVPALAWIVRPLSQVRAAATWLQQAPARPRLNALGRALHVLDADGEQPTIVVPDAQVDAVVDTTSVAERLLAAMHAHRSQVQEATAIAPAGARGAQPVADHSEDRPRPDVPPDGQRPDATIGWFALSNDILQPIYGRTWLQADAAWCSPEALRATVTELTGPAPAVGGPAGTDGRDHLPPERTVVEEAPRWYLMAMGLFTVVLGAVFAAAGTAFHRWSAPWGVIMALVAVAAGGVLARSFADRRGAMGYAAAVLVTIFLATWWRPGGDVLVAAQPIGYVWLVGSLLAGVVGMAAPRGWFRDEP
ncbi:PIG-L family deacetylase [Ruania albidiflava]|uniref:PIG-L family deacetylase n=1 Tax=Ruania albidiflava TaxID=366586 RepID=UPI0003B335C6|nr:PIG-L family deacetylase [Ruania albidiflava]